MENIGLWHQIVAIFTARIFLGLLFFFQGYDSVFKIKIKNVISTYQSSFSNNGIPKYFTIAASWFTSCSALIGGLFLIIGAFEYCCLYLLAINLILTAIGFGINTPMWDTRFVFPRLVLLLVLLIVPQAWHSWSIDSLIFK